MSLTPSNTYNMLRISQVQSRIGLSRSTIYSLLNPNSPFYDPKFPSKVNIGVKAVAWVESEIEAWLESRVVASRSQLQQDNTHNRVGGAA